MTRRLSVAIVALAACDGPRPAATASPARPLAAESPSFAAASPPPTPISAPRCERAGGKCVGPAAIGANPTAPCAPGMHRVDDVAVDDATGEHTPACFGIPLGEEA